MAEAPSAAAQERIRSLCRRISVAHDLDAEIQEELYGHMEDKFLAYRSGEEPVTEDDAFILVREHFGSPAVLKDLLRGVHRRPAESTFLRKALAAFIAFTAAYAVANLALITAVVYAAHRGATGGQWDAFRNIVLASEHLTLFLPVVLVVPFLLHARRRARAGHAPWYLRARISALAAIAVAALITAYLVPFPRDTEVLGRPLGPIPPWENLLDTLGPIVLGVQCLVWIAWCDEPPRTLRTAARGVAAWALWWLAVSSLLLGMTEWEVFDTALVGTQFRAEGQILGGALGDSPYRWYWQAQAPPILHQPMLLFALPVVAIPLGAAACALYILAQRLRRPPSPVSTQ